MDACIHEAVEAPTRVDFEEEVVTTQRSRLLARMKGGGMKKFKELRRPAFSGALLDIFPKCIDIIEANGEIAREFYAQKLMDAIGKGAYDHNGHRSYNFLRSNQIGPYAHECLRAWKHTRLDVVFSYGLNIMSRPEEWRKSGPLAHPTLSDVTNRGATYTVRRIS